MHNSVVRYLVTYKIDIIWLKSMSIVKSITLRQTIHIRKHRLYSEIQESRYGFNDFV